MNKKFLILLIIALIAVLSNTAYAEEVVEASENENHGLTEEQIKKHEELFGDDYKRDMTPEDMADNPFFNVKEEEDTTPVPPLSYLHAFEQTEGEWFPLLIVDSSCKLRTQFKGLRQWIIEDHGYFRGVNVKVIDGYPRIKFFRNQKDLTNSIIDPATLTHEQILEVLKNIDSNPNYYDPTEEVVEIEVPREAEPIDIDEILSKFNVEKTSEYIEDRPMLYEELQAAHARGEEVYPAGGFDIDGILTEVDPNHVPVDNTELSSEYRDEL